MPPGALLLRAFLTLSSCRLLHAICRVRRFVQLTEVNNAQMSEPSHPASQRHVTTLMNSRQVET